MRVILIVTEDGLPPIGAVGDIIDPQDADGDCYVVFDDWQCPVPPGIGFYVPHMWLVPILPATCDERVLEHVA